MAESKFTRFSVGRSRLSTEEGLNVPVSFHCEAPRSFGEAFDVLQAYGDEAKILAGGQRLIAMQAAMTALKRLFGRKA